MSPLPADTMSQPSENFLQTLQELPGALRLAAEHLRERGDFGFLNNEPDILTTSQLADLIDQCAESLASGDDSVGRRLWMIFAPISTWDDAGGDSRLGQDVFEKLDGLFRPT